MHNFRIALQFLTVLPFNIGRPIENDDYGKSLVFFPLAGVVIGSLLSVVSLICGFLPDVVAAIIVLVASVFITGGLHIDGFADTCDGFYGRKPKEDALRIMRDSRVGVMGVVGIALLLLFKFSLIVSFSRADLWRALIMMCCFARWTQSVACLLPYARNEGKGKMFVEYSQRKDVIIGGVFTLLVFVALIGFKGIAVFLVSFIPVVIFIRYVLSKIEGMTGDTIGAVSEISEVITFLVMSIFISLWS